MRKYTHMGAYAIISKKDEIILIRKSRGAYTGKLDLPGGKMEHGEMPIQSVTREIEEEVGISVKKLELVDAIATRVLWNDVNEEEDLHHIGIIYKVNDNIEENLKSDSDGLDSLGAAWYNINELKEDDVSPFAFYAINLLKNKY